MGRIIAAVKKFFKWLAIAFGALVATVYFVGNYTELGVANNKLREARSTQFAEIRKAGEEKKQAEVATVALAAKATAMAKQDEKALEILQAMKLTIDAGANLMTISKSADTLYPHVTRNECDTEPCRNIRYAFRILKKPYGGEKISAKEIDQAKVYLATAWTYFK